MEWAAPNRVVRKGLCDTETLSRDLQEVGKQSVGIATER